LAGSWNTATHAKVYDGLYELVEDPREETDEHD